MNLSIPTYIIFCFVCMYLTSCTPRQAALDLHDVLRFDPAVADQILFLQFRVSFGKKGGLEKVGLISAVAGDGKLKPFRAPVESPYKIEVVPRYRVTALEMAMVYQHPLYQDVEVYDPSGVITRKKTYEKEGAFTMRMQADPNIEKLDIYSVTPKREKVKIYTLKLKQ